MPSKNHSHKKKLGFDVADFEKTTEKDQIVKYLNQQKKFSQRMRGPSQRFHSQNFDKLKLKHRAVKTGRMLAMTNGKKTDVNKEKNMLCI